MDSNAGQLWQISAVARITRPCPVLEFVIVHSGYPGREGNRWRASANRHRRLVSANVVSILCLAARRRRTLGQTRRTQTLIFLRDAVSKHNSPARTAATRLFATSPAARNSQTIAHSQAALADRTPKTLLACHRRTRDLRALSPLSH